MQAEINKLRNKYKQSRAEEQAKESKVPEPLKILELPQEVKEQNQYRQEAKQSATTEARQMAEADIISPVTAQITQQGVMKKTER